MKLRCRLSVLALACGSTCALAEPTVLLDEMTVDVIAVKTSNALVNTTTDYKQLDRQQAHDVKDVFKGKMDVYASKVQGARVNEGVNIRGLQGNRVTTTVDGVPLPETQEAKHFMAYGSEFGRGDYVEVTGLRGADVQYAGSANSLSGSVNFSTLNPNDLLKGRNAGGFVGGGYNSIDSSVYGTLAGALAVDKYQGMALATLRDGNETINEGKVGGTGETRTEPNPADYRGRYFLTKHQYQLNDNHSLSMAFEHLHKKNDTQLLTQTGTRIDSLTGVQTSGNSTDKITRNRLSFGHEYDSDTTFVNNAKTHLYYQDANTKNHRYRQSARNYRQEDTKSGHKTLGISTDLTSYLQDDLNQVLRYGASYNHTKATNHLHYERPAYTGSTTGSAYFDGRPSADTTQDKFTAYVEDELAFGKWVLTPQLGVMYYKVNPTSADQSQVAEFVPNKRHQTEFTPKLSIEWRNSDELIPYVQYSRGVRTPSPQQLTSYFFENPTYTYRNPVTGAMVTGSSTVAVIGNPNLKAETADNFELGIKGRSSRLEYLATAYYNHYKNFIDWQADTSLGCLSGCKYTSFVQYQNLDKAKVYGATVDGKYKFDGGYYVQGGLAYIKGKAQNNGIKTPINSVQPFKAKLGAGYDSDTFGANILVSYSDGKSSKDIEQSSSYLYNPTKSYGLVDIGGYYKFGKNLTLTANVNNVFDKKYWDWSDISYLALLSKASVDQGRGSNGIPLAITEANADRYSASGRNFNIGIRYEF